MFYCVHRELRITAVIATILLYLSSVAFADDLMNNYTWIVAQSDSTGKPKLGLQPADPDHRSMAFERLMLVCDGARTLTVTAWPVKLRGRVPASVAAMKFVTDGTLHLLPNPRNAFSDMDEVWQVEAEASDLQVVRDMLKAKSILLTAPGVSMRLPKATSAVSAFLARCERNVRGGASLERR